MPTLTYRFTKRELIVPVIVGIDGPTMANLRRSGRPVIPPIQVHGCIDTGSTVSSVSQAIVTRFALTVTGTGSSTTATGRVPVNTYEVSLSIFDPADPSGSVLTLPSLEVSGMITHLPNIDVLIGMDVLEDCTFTIDGPNGTFSFDF